jgi:hypothetical protein
MIEVFYIFVAKMGFISRFIKKTNKHKRSLNQVIFSHYFRRDSRTNIPNIIKMKVRTDDVFLIAYPKAGK